MVLGITYARGRTQTDTIETAAPVREAGQFTSLLSCPVRASEVVKFTVGTTFTPTSGGVVLYLDPDNNHNAGGQPATGVVFEWATDANNYIRIEYVKSATEWRLHRKLAGAGTSAVFVGTFNAGDALCVIASWSSTGLSISVNGATAGTASNSSIPTLPTTCEVGGASVTSGTRFEAGYGALAGLSGAPSAAATTLLVALRAARPPILGEATNLMTGLWYGGHSVYWSLATGGTTYDFMNTDGTVVRTFDGAGISELEHRTIETPLRDGSSYVDARMVNRSLGMTLAVYADPADQASYYARRRAILSALNPRRGLGLIGFATDGEVFEIDAVLEAGLGFDTFVGPEFQYPVLTFLCPNPFWRSGILLEEILTVVPSGLSVPITIPMSIDEAAITETFENTGDVDTFPSFVITAGTRGLTTVTIENVTTGKLFRLEDLELAASEVLYVDFDERTATLNGASVLSYRSDASRMWSLEPGDNEVKIGVDAGDFTSVVRLARTLVGV